MERSKIGIDSLSGVFFSIVSLVVAMVAIPLLLAFLGSDRFAVWALILTIGSWQNLARLGFSLSLTKFVAKQGRSKEPLKKNSNCG